MPVPKPYNESFNPVALKNVRMLLGFCTDNSMPSILYAHSCQIDIASNRQILERKSSNTFFEIVKKSSEKINKLKGATKTKQCSKQTYVEIIVLLILTTNASIKKGKQLKKIHK